MKHKPHRQVVQEILKLHQDLHSNPTITANNLMFNLKHNAIYPETFSKDKQIKK